MSRYDKAVKLNPEPSDYLIARMAKLRELGKSPGNPKWYKVPTLPRFEFTPNLPPKLPNLATRMSNESHRAWVFERFLCQPLDYKTPQQYVEAFDLANGFKPAPITWIRPQDGNYA